MLGRGAWRSRGFAIAVIALSFAVIAPELGPPAGAAPARTELASRRRQRRPASAATRKARILAAMRARGNAAATARRKAGQPVPTYATKTKTTVKPKNRSKFGTSYAAKLRLAAAKRKAAARKAALRRRAANALIARRAPKHKKKSSLSLPTLAFLAVLPFLLMGLYLLGADYLRRRDPRKRGRGRGGAGLVITRVGNR